MLPYTIMTKKLRKDADALIALDPVTNRDLDAKQVC